MLCIQLISYPPEAFRHDGFTILSVTPYDDTTLARVDPLLFLLVPCTKYAEVTTLDRV